MGIRAVQSHPLHEPKGTCPKCQRPIVLLKSASCLYCGARIPGALNLVAAQPGMPPELLIALEPKARGRVSPGNRWFMRILALGATAVLIATVMGTCMSR